jgi:UDP-GlcNAc3NAcA epimerase
MIARRLRLMGSDTPFDEVLVHTGQHYDPMLSDVFFRELGVPAPQHNLEVGSGTAGKQIACILERLDPVVESEKPDAILVYGDTNSTLAASLIAAHRNVPLVHVEAGERIFRRLNVPEEVNRVLTDNAAALCLTCTKRASSYLLREGMAPDRVRFVGDPMFDLFVWGRAHVNEKSQVGPASFGVEPEQYHLATIHRAQNTIPETLVNLFKTLDGSELPVILPVHPRVRDLLKKMGWKAKGNLKLIEPLGYFEFLAMLLACRACITDSGGVSREAFFARRPCIIPMQNSWWPEIIQAGWAMETGEDYNALADAIATFRPCHAAPDGMFGDGDSSSRIIAEVAGLCGSMREPAWHPHGAWDLLPKVAPTDFTYTAYCAMLNRLLGEGYRFATFPEAATILKAGQPFVLMRHDIDFDLDKALKIAELEASLSVAATYFFLLRTTHYNVFSREGSAAVKRILSAGHHLGLHFDCASYSQDSVEELCAAASREAAILEQWFDRPVETVSYHRPNAGVLSGNPALSAPRPHTYQPLFTGPIWYCSDSRGRWPAGAPDKSEAFREKRPMHLLVHPIWWNEEPVGAYETLQRYIDASKDALEKSTAANCTVYQVGRLSAPVTGGAK